MKTLLKTGAIAGACGGISLAVFLATVGRSPIRDAIDLEESLEASQGGAVQEDLFSRGVQELGGMLGLALFGIAVGLIFAVVLGAVGRQLGGGSVFNASLRLGAIGFWTVVVVPFIKYPGNPPAVGDPETINERTLQYIALVSASIALTLAVSRLGQGRSLSPVARTWLKTVVYGGGLAALVVIFPDNPDEIAAPAELIWRFRLASIGGLAVLWTVLALTAGTLLERGQARAAGVRGLSAEPVSR